MRRFVWVCLVFAIAAVLFPAVFYGQTTTAQISGTVRDSSGGVVPGAAITIRNTGTGISRALQSDAQGRYVAPDLSIGSYEVQVGSAGFQTQVRAGITLTVGQRAVFNFTLTPGAVLETVTVTEEAPLVETASSSVGTLVTQAQISELPLNGRDYTQLALLQPGVVLFRENSPNLARGQGAAFSISGARINQVGYRLNGLNIKDSSGGTPGSSTGHNLGVDAIQEFQVLTNTFSAEHGNAAGGILNIVQKSGTNEFHGSLFEYLRNSALDARNFFDREEVPPFRRNQFGGSLGGPIVREKTFFFGNYEILKERLALTAVNQVLSPEARNGTLFPISPSVRPYVDVMPAPNGAIFPGGVAESIVNVSTKGDEHYVVAKGDHTFSSSDFLSASYTYDKGTTVAPDATAGIVTYTTSNATRFHYINLQHTHVFSPSVLNNFRVGYNRSFGQTFQDPLLDIPSSLRFIEGRSIAEMAISGLGDFPLSFGPNVEKTQSLSNFQFGNTLNWIHGRHTVKAGVEGQWDTFDRLSHGGPAWGGAYEFDSIELFLAGTPSSFDGDAGEAASVIHQRLHGFFFQDDMQVTPTLTVNLGLRYEFVTTPTSTRPNQGTLVSLTDPELTIGRTWIKNPSLKNFAPRVGLAWDVFGNQKTAVRSGFGIFYDQHTNYYYRQVIDNNPPAPPTLSLRRNVPFPNAFDQIQNAETPPLPSLSMINYRPNQPYRIQYNLGIQHELTPGTSVAVYYVGARAVHNGQYFSNINSRQPSGRTADGRLFFDRNSPPLNPNFGVIQLRNVGGDEYYQGLQMNLQRRLAAGLQFQASYTWSRNIDNGSSVTAQTESYNTAIQQNQFEPESERGLSAIDVRHVFSANTNYDLPAGQGWNPIARGVFGGWQVGGILTLATGHPFTPILGFDNANILTRRRGDALRPDLAPGANNNPVLGGVRKYFDDTAFVLPPSGTLGNLARNTIIGPGLAQVDFSLKKRFLVTERMRLDFRTEMFNLFNHSNFQFPAPNQTVVIQRGGARNPTAGQILSTSTTSRQIQFSLRMDF